MFHALLQSLVGVDHRLGKSDGFEVRPHFEIKLVVAITGGVCSGSGVLFEAAPGGGFGANAFEDSPGLVQGSGRGDDVLDLVAAGEGTSVEENELVGLLS